MTQAERLAAEFGNRMRAALSASEFEEMRRRNAEQTCSAICHSHDFCDANMVMDAAFKAVTGHSIGEREEAGNGGFSDAELDLWNEAWTIAKRDTLTAPKGGGFIGREATEVASNRATLWL